MTDLALGMGFLGFGVEVLTNVFSAEFGEALASVTSLAAQACAADDRKGRIAPGYDADLLAVTGNPAADLTAILHPTAIYRAGHRCDTGPPSPP